MEPAIPGTARALRRLADHAPGAWEELCTLQATPLLRLAVAIAGRDAEDACNEAFVALHRQARRFPGADGDDEHAQAWLRRVAINAILEHRRRERRRTRRERPIAGAEPMTTAPADAGLDEAERGAVLDALAGLRPRERDLLVARFWECQPIALIAQRSGVAEGTLRVRLHRALARLRRTLATSAPALAGFADERILAAPPPAVEATAGTALLARLRAVPAGGAPIGLAGPVAIGAAALLAAVLRWWMSPTIEEADDDAGARPPTARTSTPAHAIAGPASLPADTHAESRAVPIALQRSPGPTVIAAHTRFGASPNVPSPRREIRTIVIAWSETDAPAADGDPFPYRVPERILRSLPDDLVIAPAVGPVDDPARAHLAIGGGSGDGRHRVVLMPCEPIADWLQSDVPGFALELSRTWPTRGTRMPVLDAESELAVILQSGGAHDAGDPTRTTDDASVQAFWAEVDFRAFPPDPHVHLFGSEHGVEVTVPLRPAVPDDATPHDASG